MRWPARKRSRAGRVRTAVSSSIAFWRSPTRAWISTVRRWRMPARPFRLYRREIGRRKVDWRFYSWVSPQRSRQGRSKMS